MVMRNIFILLVFVFLFNACNKKERTFYPNGKVEYILQTNNSGEKDGWNKKYNPNGQLEFKFKYKNGIKNELKYYFENGNLKSITIFDEKGEFERDKWFYLNKNLKYETELIDTIKQRIWYYENENLMQIEYYKNDLLHDKIEIYDTTGFLKTKTLYKNGICQKRRDFDKFGNETYYFEIIDTSESLRYADFNIKFKHKTDTFRIGDTTFIDIRHENISKYQILPKFQNGDWFNDMKKDSYRIWYVPKKIGTEFFVMYVQFTDSIKRTVWVQTFDVKN